MSASESSSVVRRLAAGSSSNFASDSSSVGPRDAAAASAAAALKPHAPGAPRRSGSSPSLTTCAAESPGVLRPCKAPAWASSPVGPLTAVAEASPQGTRERSSFGAGRDRGGATLAARIASPRPGYAHQRQAAQARDALRTRRGPRQHARACTEPRELPPRPPSLPRGGRSARTDARSPRGTQPSRSAGRQLRDPSEAPPWDTPAARRGRPSSEGPLPLWRADCLPPTTTAETPQTSFRRAPTRCSR